MNFFVNALYIGCLAGLSTWAVHLFSYGRLFCGFYAAFVVVLMLADDYL